MDIYWTLFGVHVLAGYCKDALKAIYRVKYKRDLQNDITRLINEFDNYMDVEPVSIPININRMASALVVLDRIFFFPYRTCVLNNQIMSTIRSRADGVKEDFCDPELERLRSEAVKLYKGQKTDKEDVDALLGKNVKQLKERLEMLDNLEELKKVVLALPNQSSRQETKLRILEEMADLKCRIDEYETDPPSMKLKNLDYLEVCLHYLPEFQQLTYLRTNVNRMIAEEEGEQNKVRELEDCLININSLERMKLICLIDESMPSKLKEVRALYKFVINDLDKLPPEYLTKTGMEIIKELMKQATENRKQEVIHELVNGGTNLYGEENKLSPIDPSKLSQMPVEPLTPSQNDVVSYVRTEEVVVS